MASTSLEVVISAKDRFSATANKVIGSLNKMDASSRRVGTGVAQLGTGLASAAVKIGVAAATGLAAVAKVAIDWEDAFAGVRKTVDEVDLRAAGLTFRDLELGLRRMSTEMPIAATELAGIAEQAGALGIKAQDILEFTRIAALIGITTDVSSEQAATALGQLSNVLGLTAADYDNFGATLVDLGNKGASTESQILEMAARAGASAKLVGIAADQTLGWSSAVANLGIEVEAGGSALQKFFLESLDMVASGGTDLARMAKVAGMTGKQFEQAFATDASGALATFLAGLGKLDQAAQLNTLQDLGFNDIRITRMLLGLAGNTDNLTGSLDIANKAWAENTALSEEARKRFETLRSKLTLLKSGLLESALIIGEGFTPALGGAVDKLGAFLKDSGNRDTLRKLGQDIGAFIAGINWREVLDGARSFVDVMRIAVEFAKTLLGAVRALPTELQAAGLGFLALDKLSGGLIHEGVGNIAGGLAGAATRGIAAKIPGVGSVFAQPVFVTNWPLGGFGGDGLGPETAAAGGLGSTIAGAIRAALLVAPPVFVIDELAAKPLRTALGVPDINPANLPAGSNATKPFWELPGFRWPWEATPPHDPLAAEPLGPPAPSASDLEQMLRDSVETTGTAITTSSRESTDDIVAALRANRPIVNVAVDVTATAYTQAVAVNERYGSTTGSQFYPSPRAIAE